MAQQMIADNQIDIAASRGLILQACWELDQGRSAGMAVSIAKTFTSEAVWRVVDRSLQLCGSLGVSGDLPLGRFLREVRPFRPCHHGHHPQQPVTTLTLESPSQLPALILKIIQCFVKFI
jgi:alkylation response protein AidB-like acyl-CoA dehydrogenase